MNNLRYFKETYEESRRDFLDLAKKVGGELRSHKISDELSFESFYLQPAGKKEKLLILSSGIHGIEGHTGSALQRYFLDNNFLNLKNENMGILILHGINAYGFKHNRRMTENNVDLNRNFDMSHDLFQTENEGYAMLNPFLNPKNGYSRFAFYPKTIRYILKYGMGNLRQAILKGQYQFPEGIFFGGKTFEPHVSLIQNELVRVGEGFEKVLLLDLHTGFGQRGKLHLFGDRTPYIDLDHMNKVFKGQSIDYGSEKEFYVISGGFTVFLAKLFHQKTKFAGVVYEFGTVDGHKPLGSLDSLYRMINEKQNKTLFKEMFYPEDPAWRQSVLEQFKTSVVTTIQNW